MPTISKINGLTISAADASYVAGGNVDGAVTLATTANTASYISPTFISASAAASGFGSGGGGSTAATASLALAVSSSNVTDNISYRVALLSSGGNTTIGQNSNITYNPLTNKLRVPTGQIEAVGITGSINGTVTNATLASSALTASFVNTLNQNVTINGNLSVFGTASYSYVSASQLNVGTNTISVNVAEPAERFGGLIVYDSGSLSHQATASLLWDSLNNHWIYQNASGSTYSGGMLISGPRNLGAIGNEVGTTNNALMKGQGGDHITSSRIFDDGTNVYTNSNVQITGSLKVTGGVTASLQGTATYATNAGETSQVYIAENDSPGTYSIPVYQEGNFGSYNSLFNANNVSYDFATGRFTFTALQATGSLQGTASYAVQALTALTASYALSSAGVAGGVTSITAGDGISVNQSTGAVTITNTGGTGGGTNLGLVYAVSLGYLMP
jgi:hypothetical protein